MAKINVDKELYRRMRDSGVRKRVARELARLPALGSNGGRMPKAVRDAIDRLDSVTSELRKHAVGDGRKAAARKPAARKAAARKPAARKAAGRKPAVRASTKNGSGSARKSEEGRQAAG